ncbi:hypothetical protein F0225_19090 [Vibrio pectenicida]|uniref:Uncharacterized protein n=1 Tax=Vibrio pectenicida TaxID=62763 RepID=A0A7Y4A296_9VIBR|nr:hypothetical protein [Vibrio pectenicida]NOH73420.1 hypothetical protein [Vibrio pectenicida]
MSEELTRIRQCFLKAFPSEDHEYGRDVKRGLHSIFVNISKDERLIFKITDNCIDDNAVDKILLEIEKNCFRALRSNPNKECVLYSNFEIKIQNVT